VHDELGAFGLVEEPLDTMWSRVGSARVRRAGREVRHDLIGDIVADSRPGVTAARAPAASRCAR